MPTTKRRTKGRKAKVSPPKPEGYTVSRLRSAAVELSDYPETYALCRELGHSWRVDEQELRGSTLYRLFVCNRGCPRTRADITNRWGQLIDRKYNNPADYVIHGTGNFEGRVNKQFWHSMAFIRMVEDGR